MAMNVTQAADYVTGLGLSIDVWKTCHECGTCNGKKIKCRNGNYELQLYYSRGKYNLFNSGKAVKGGVISNIVSDLTDI